MTISEQIRKQILLAVQKLAPGMGVRPEEIALEHPAAEGHGDYSTNVALQAFKTYFTGPGIKSRQISVLAGTPREFAEKTVLELEKGQDKVWEKVEVAGPGFINFWLSKEWLIENLDKAEKNEILKGKKIMVEFAHPNTHKMFHIGHLRNITLGESLIRLFESQGAKVVRANYQGDVGLHIAKAIYGILQVPSAEFERLKTLDEKIKFLGKTYAAGATAYEEDKEAQGTIKDMNYLVYAAAQRFQKERGINPGTTDYLKFVEDRAVGTNKVYEIWKKTRQWSLDYFDKVYERVYTHYDRFYFESECLAGVDLANEAVKKGVLKESDGAIVFDGKPFGLDTRVFVNSLGLPTYEGKELALSTTQFKEHPDLFMLMHVLGPEQISFTQVTFKAEELLGIQKGQQFHFAYGWVKLKKGKMSSRTGNVVLGEWLIDEIKAKLKEKYPDKLNNTESVAVAAAKYSLLRVGPHQEIAFDIDESISLEGDSGPYLQYTYARARSVLRKQTTDYRLQTTVGKKSVGSRRWTVDLVPEESAVLRYLYRFPEVVEQAAKQYAPNVVCSYLFELAKRYNNLYNNCPILGNEFRIQLTQSTAQVLKNGLNLLGVQALEKM